VPGFSQNEHCRSRRGDSLDLPRTPHLEWPLSAMMSFRNGSDLHRQPLDSNTPLSIPRARDSLFVTAASIMTPSFFTSLP